MSSIRITGYPNPAPRSAPGKSYKELAIWSVICAIWMGMVGIILGMIALRFMRASNNFDGRNIALAGIIIGAISTVGYVFVLYALANGSVLGLFLGGAITSCVPSILSRRYGSPTLGRSLAQSGRRTHNRLRRCALLHAGGIGAWLQPMAVPSDLLCTTRPRLSRDRPHRSRVRR
jgi:predicted permease